jgi:uncharacterized coiled-coil protein SlyX
MLIVASQTARADECADLLNEANDLLTQADYIIDKQSNTIDLLTDQNDRLQKALDYSLAEAASAKAAQQAWYRDPKVVAPVTFVLGVALGAYVVKGR